MIARSIIIALLLLVLNLWGRLLIIRYLPAHYADPILNGLAVALLVAAAFVLDRLIRRFYWTGYLKRRRNRETPALIQDIVTILILASALAIGLRVNAGLTITGIVAASGAVAFVLGIALQPVIQDLFSGLSINFDGSYALGDWLTLYSDQMPQPIYGCVSGITWRTTFLRLEDGRRLMIPNRLMSTNPVMNHSRPHEAKRLSVEVAIDIRVPINRVIDMLLGEAFKATRQRGLVRTPPPEIIVNRITSDSAFYEVRFYALPDQIEPGAARSAMLRALLDVVQQNELPLPVTQVELTKPPNLKLVLGAQEVSEALCRVNLFANALNGEQVAQLASRCQTSELPLGTVLMRQGDHAASMFIIMEGAASITISGGNDGMHEVAVSATGDVVGEMSLMTGAPRTATVTALTRLRVLEITKEQIEDLLKVSPELLQRFSTVLGKRQRELDELTQRVTQNKNVEADLMSRMRSFFSNVFSDEPED